ncbi:MAG: ATP-binding protein [Flavobacteriaceae bacterium]
METNNGYSLLLNEMDWLARVIDQSIRSYLLQEGHQNHWHDIPLPDLSEAEGSFAEALTNWNVNTVERLALALAMAPHLKPEVLDIFFGKNKLYDRGFTEFGGVVDENHSGFLPTVQTLLFLATATSPEYYDGISGIFENNHVFMREQVLVLGDTEPHIPRFNGVLGINKRWMHYFLTGTMPALEQSASFPAQKITTPLDWEDVVLDPVVMNQVEEIKIWLQHGDTLMNDWGLQKHLKPGYRALFYGPPGTGKTLTTTLLGKISSREVYKVDLSMIVSKYIGETEKNLARIFDIAQHKDWILFFDEADALFGKRTVTSSSNDRYANQQTAYLLQRIEDYPGVVILASNLKANMDDAFTRRFQTMIHFPMPGPQDRFHLWKNVFSGTCTLSAEIDLQQIAESYELSGGSIINVLRYCALSAIKREDTIVTSQELREGIRREFKKENKTL